MKRIDAYIKKIALRDVAKALKKVGVGGITVDEVRGRGSSEVPVVSGLRGTARFVADFNPKNIVTVIVDDSRVEQVIATIIETAGTGHKGDGKIFVTNVEDAIDIGSKRRGPAAI